MQILVEGLPMCFIQKFRFGLEASRFPSDFQAGARREAISRVFFE